MTDTEKKKAIILKLLYKLLQEVDEKEVALRRLEQDLREIVKEADKEGIKKIIVDKITTFYKMRRNK